MCNDRAMSLLPAHAQVHQMPGTLTNREIHNRAHGARNATTSVLTSLRRGDITHLRRGILHRVMYNIEVNATRLHMTCNLDPDIKDFDITYIAIYLCDDKRQTETLMH